MAVPHGPASVGAARRRLRRDLGDREIPDTVIDDAVLILSELLSNSCRYARPLSRLTELDNGILVRWQMHGDGLLTLEVTDGGAVTRPLPARPSLTSRGGRGLAIVGRLASDWGVRDTPGEVTVWAALPARARHARREPDVRRETDVHRETGARGEHNAHREDDIRGDVGTRREADVRSA